MCIESYRWYLSLEVVKVIVKTTSFITNYIKLRNTNFVHDHFCALCLSKNLTPDSKHNNNYF